MNPQRTWGQKLSKASIVLGSLAFIVCLIQATCFPYRWTDRKMAWTVVDAKGNEYIETPKEDRQWRVFVADWVALPAVYTIGLCICIALVSLFDEQAEPKMLVVLIANIILFVVAGLFQAAQASPPL